MWALAYAYNVCTGFGVPTAVITISTIYWGEKLWRPTDIPGSSCCFLSLYFHTEEGGLDFAETSVNFCQETSPYILEYSNNSYLTITNF